MRGVAVKSIPSGKVRDIVGERFGRLTVVSFSHIADNNGKNAYWNCLCDCGESSTVSSGSLRVGSTKSCGCLARELSRAAIKKIHNTGKHLYFIRSGEYVKIGRTDNINKRLSQLNAMNPHGVDLIHFLEDEGYREKEMHEKFKKQHWRGEWFTISDRACEVVAIGKVD